MFNSTMILLGDAGMLHSKTILAQSRKAGTGKPLIKAGGDVLNSYGKRL
jgi:hypothetical protein